MKFGEGQAIRRLEPQVRMAAFESGQLLFEREILQSQVTMPTEGGEERRDAGN